MRRIPFLAHTVVATLFLTVVAAPVGAQPGRYPPISARQFEGGSVRVTVTGSAAIEQEIALNTKASFGDGEVTWLQFGVSGADTPNALITYGEGGEIGIAVGRGKFIATGGLVPGERSECTGKVQVTENSITGEYSCAGVTSHDPSTDMGKVDIKVSFTAKS